jgi:uncharacterized membrane-anchored protein
MSQAVIVLWAILLIVTVLVLPIIVTLLHKTWKAARSIQRYFAEMETAGNGIAENTGHIPALEDTISVAGGMLETAGDINSNAETIENVLGDRADKLN